MLAITSFINLSHFFLLCFELLEGQSHLVQGHDDECRGRGRAERGRATPVAVSRRHRQSRSVTVTGRRSALDKGKVSEAQAIACTACDSQAYRRLVYRANNGGSCGSSSVPAPAPALSFASFFVTIENGFAQPLQIPIQESKISLKVLSN